MLTFLVLTATCVTLILTLLTKWYIHWNKYTLDGIPGPKPLPVLGNILDFGLNPEGILERFNNLTKQFDGIFKLYLGTKTVLVVLTDPVYIKPFLNSSTHLNKTDFYDFYAPFIKNGLILTNESHWRGNRKLLAPSFNYSMLEQFNQVFNSTGNRLISNLKLKLGTNIDIYEDVNISAMENVYECVLGMKMSKRFEEHMNYLENMDGFFKIAMNRAFSFYKRNETIFRLTPEYKQQEKYLSLLREYTINLIRCRIEERKHEANTGDSNEVDQKPIKGVLDCLLDAYDQDELPIEYIREEVDTFLLAGHHTISCGLACIAYELSKHPDIQEKILAEANSILGDDRAAFITTQQSNDMKYLESVIKEGLRLYSPAPFIERILESDVEINGMVIPKGTAANFFIFAMHRSEKLYPDPLKFDPERFNAENCAKRDPYAFLPFSAGPRNCIGWKFSMLQMKCSLVKIIREFKICEAPDNELELWSDGTLKSKTGFPVVLQTRY